MIVLGIETSCDETAAAVLDGGRKVLSSVVASQDEVHAPYGGVVPELASRRHLEMIVPVIRRALSEAGMGLRDLDGIAVTQGPGLVGSLLVGVAFAKAAAAAAGLPLVATHHLAGHIESLVLQNGELPLPAVVLVVSGAGLLRRPEDYQAPSRRKSSSTAATPDGLWRIIMWPASGMVTRRPRGKAANRAS